jgi:glycosyltransferase involved in cell wall biosynthesis
MKKEPLVSIITPVLNGIKYLRQCVESVLNQDYPCVEHVFVDGGSTDGTLELLEEYQKKYPEKIVVFSDPKLNKGAGEAWNVGWKIAKGDIFGWLGADDFYEPGAISTVVKFFQENPDAYFVFGDCNVVNEKGEILLTYPKRNYDLKTLINTKNFIPTTSAFYRREVVEKIGPMDTSITGGDWDYWVRVGRVFKLHYINKTLSNFRMHSEGITGKKESRRMYIYDDFKISRRYGGSLFSRRAFLYYIMVIIDHLGPLKSPAFKLFLKTIDLAQKFYYRHHSLLPK